MLPEAVAERAGQQQQHGEAQDHAAARPFRRRRRRGQDAVRVPRVARECPLMRGRDVLVHCGSSAKTPCAGLPSLRLRSTANRYGTTNSVVGVANRSPPITARASEAFCSSPAPPIAIGIMPTIIAAAALSTGRIWGGARRRG